MTRYALSALLLASASALAANPVVPTDSDISAPPAASVEAEALPQREQAVEPTSPTARPAQSAMVAVRDLKIYPAF